MFDIKIGGIDTIDTDYTDFQRKVDKGINYGLKAFASELTPALQKHIQQEVYDAYTPLSYKRRQNFPQYGRSIYSENNMEYHFMASGKGVEFTYEPQGRNNLYPYSPYYEDGDSIIETIENDSRYLWLPSGSIGKKRQFWGHFVMETEFVGDSWFVKGFNQADASIQAVSDGKIVTDNSDYDLHANYTINQGYRMDEGSDDSDSGDLPF